MDPALEPWLRVAGRMHVLLIHFPIALILTALACELGWLMFRRGKPKVQQVVAPGARPADVVRLTTGASPTGIVCVTLAAIAAAVTSATGWLNADFEGVGGSEADTLFWHRWLGIAVAVTAFLAMIFAAAGWRSRSPRAWKLYRMDLMLAAVLVLFAGHFGGQLVWGEGYVLKPLRPTPPRVAQTSASGSESPNAGPAETSGLSATAAAGFEKVLPIFEAHCVECHGPDKTKRQLRLDSVEGVLASDVIKPGDAAASDLVRRISLPPEDPDFMPEEGPALTADQIRTISDWIDGLAAAEPVATARSGPPEAARQTDRSQPSAAQDAAKRDAANPAAVPGSNSGPLSDAQRAARDATVARLIQRGAVALPAYAGADTLEVDFHLLGRAITDDDLRLLSGLEPVLESLNLGGTAVTDDGLGALSGFGRLRKLALQQTSVTDAGLKHLASLPALEELNLFGTRVSDAGIESLAQIKRLRKVFLWQTLVTPAGAERLKAALPDAYVDTGAVVTSRPVPAAPVAAEAKTVKAACCREAEAAGKKCDHPCCVEAAAKGISPCPKCAV